MPPPAPPPFTIRQATTPTSLTAVASLFRAYHAWLALDLTFQDFSAELAGLPGKYAVEHGGRVFLAFLNCKEEEGEGEEEGEEGEGEAVGCIALRDITRPVAEWESKRASPSTNTNTNTPPPRKIGEVKRLYTLPAARGLGVGSALIDAILSAAREEGYTEVRLDTLPRMQGAMKLYSRAGFVETGRYYDTELEGTVFMRRTME